MNATLINGGRVHWLPEKSARCGVGKNRERGQWQTKPEAGIRLFAVMPASAGVLPSLSVYFRTSVEINGLDSEHFTPKPRQADWLHISWSVETRKRLGITLRVESGGSPDCPIFKQCYNSRVVKLENRPAMAAQAAAGENMNKV